MTNGTSYLHLHGYSPSTNDNLAMQIIAVTSVLLVTVFFSLVLLGHSVIASQMTGNEILFIIEKIKNENFGTLKINKLLFTLAK